MNLDTWTKNEKLCTWLKAVLNTPNGKTLLVMLDNQHPRNTQLPHTDADSVKSTELGRIYGYDMALNIIAAAANFNPAQPPLNETYGVITPVKSD